MRRACDAIIAGDYFTAMTDLTQEASNDAMALAAQLTQVPVPQSYEITSHETLGADERFGARFQTTLGELNASVTWRQFDGFWKIVALSVDGV